MVVHRDGARTAEQVKVAITGRFSELPVHVRLSLMWDQGIEMARQHESRKWLVAVRRTAIRRTQRRPDASAMPAVMRPAHTLKRGGTGVRRDNRLGDQPPIAATGPMRAAPYQQAIASRPPVADATVADATVNTTANTEGRTRPRASRAASDNRIDVAARSNEATITVTWRADRWTRAAPVPGRADRRGQRCQRNRDHRRNLAGPTTGFRLGRGAAVPVRRPSSIRHRLAYR